METQRNGPAMPPKPLSRADKGRTEAGDQLSFAQTGLRLQKNSSGKTHRQQFLEVHPQGKHAGKYHHKLFVYKWQSFLFKTQRQRSYSEYESCVFSSSFSYKNNNISAAVGLIGQLPSNARVDFIKQDHDKWVIPSLTASSLPSVGFPLPGGC